MSIQLSSSIMNIKYIIREIWMLSLVIRKISKVLTFLFFNNFHFAIKSFLLHNYKWVVIFF